MVEQKESQVQTKLVALKFLFAHQLKTKGFILYNQNHKILTESVLYLTMFWIYWVVYL